MSDLELQSVCLLCGEHFSGPGVGIFGVGLVFECERAPRGSLGLAFNLGDLKPPTALAFAPNVPHRIEDWQDPAGNHDPGDEDDAAERAWTAEHLAAMRSLREAFSKILGAELARVGFETTLLAVPVPP